LKQAYTKSVTSQERYFNPHFLSLTFETCWRTTKYKGFAFQSSFSEFDLWNRANAGRSFKKTNNIDISILIFWVWPLKQDISIFCWSDWIYFNPHFLSLTFETGSSSDSPTLFAHFNPHFLSLTFETRCGAQNHLSEFAYFNPHFLSLTFETILVLDAPNLSIEFQSSFSEFDLWNCGWSNCVSRFKEFQSSFSEFDLWNIHRPTWEAIQVLISILIFWVWPLKRDTMNHIELSRIISILIFWVWPLKHWALTFLRFQGRNFNPHFLSLTFET